MQLLRVGSVQLELQHKWELVILLFFFIVVVICPIWSKLTPYRIQCLISVLIFAAIVVLSPLTSYFNNSSAIVQSLATLFPFAFCVFIRCIAFKQEHRFCFIQYMYHSDFQQYIQGVPSNRYGSRTNVCRTVPILGQVRIIG